MLKNVIIVMTLLFLLVGCASASKEVKDYQELAVKEADVAKVLDNTNSIDLEKVEDIVAFKVLDLNEAVLSKISSEETTNLTAMLNQLHLNMKKKASYNVADEALQEAIKLKLNTGSYYYNAPIYDFKGYEPKTNKYIVKALYTVSGVKKDVVKVPKIIDGDPLEVVLKSKVISDMLEAAKEEGKSGASSGGYFDNTTTPVTPAVTTTTTEAATVVSNENSNTTLFGEYRIPELIDSKGNLELTFIMSNNKIEAFFMNSYVLNSLYKEGDIGKYDNNYNLIKDEIDVFLTRLFTAYNDSSSTGLYVNYANYGVMSDTNERLFNSSSLYYSSYEVSNVFYIDMNTVELEVTTLVDEGNWSPTMTDVTYRDKLLLKLSRNSDRELVVSDSQLLQRDIVEEPKLRSLDYNDTYLAQLDIILGKTEASDEIIALANKVFKDLSTAQVTNDSALLNSTLFPLLGSTEEYNLLNSLNVKLSKKATFINSWVYVTKTDMSVKLSEYMTVGDSTQLITSNIKLRFDNGYLYIVDYSVLGKEYIGNAIDTTNSIEALN